jgi:hypothetical protein
MKPELISLRKQLISSLPNFNSLSPSEVLEIVEYFTSYKLKQIYRHSKSVDQLIKVPEYYKLDIDVILAILCFVERKGNPYTIEQVLHIPKFYCSSYETLEYILNH